MTAIKRISFKISVITLAAVLSFCSKVYAAETVSAAKSSLGTAPSAIDLLYRPQAAEGTAVVTLSSDDVHAFVTRLYSICLSRDPDAAGLDDWCGRIESGQLSGADVVLGFFHSKEFLSDNLTNENFLGAAYCAILGREPDSDGYSHWLAYLEDGCSRDYVLSGFINSSEFSSLCGQYEITRGDFQTLQIRDVNPTITAFVNRLYLYCLGRSGEEDGLNNWCNRIESGQLSGADVVLGFFHSKEFLSDNLTNENFLHTAYRTMLGREPDSDGYSHWLAYLEDGCSRDYVLSGFINSSEFSSLCGQYGITRGDFQTSQIRDVNPTITAFVNRLYLYCLGRSGEEDGLNNWCRQILNGGMDGADLAFLFYHSDEYTSKQTSNTDFVTSLYHIVLNREPDGSGFDHWTGILDGGCSREYVICGFVNSAEYHDLCSRYGIAWSSYSIAVEPRDVNPAFTAFVTRLYRYCLGREPDTGGLNANVSVLLNGSLNGTDLAVSFFHSQEMSNRSLTSTDWASAAYLSLLDREPDDDGLAEWVSALDAGCSRDYILAGFLNSSEFGNLCSKFGIKQGYFNSLESRDVSTYFTQFAAHLYSALLGRSATADELNTATSDLISDTYAAIRMLPQKIIASDEFKTAHTTDESVLKALNDAFCGGKATDATVLAWSKLLKSRGSDYTFDSVFLSTDAGSFLGAISCKSFVRHFGIDVSQYQNKSTIDWAAVKSSGKSFAIVRAVSASSARGTFIDDCFFSNVKGAYAAGLKVGAYYYMLAVDENELVYDINMLLSALKTAENDGSRFEYPIYIDVEDPYLRNHTTLQERTALVKEALKMLTDAGYYAAVYTYKVFALNYIDMAELADFDVWIAHFDLYPSELDFPAASWQYSSTGSVGGISGNVDLDICYRNYPSVIRALGMNHLN